MSIYMWCLLFALIGFTIGAGGTFLALRAEMHKVAPVGECNVEVQEDSLFTPRKLYCRTHGYHWTEHVQRACPGVVVLAAGLPEGRWE